MRIELEPEEVLACIIRMERARKLGDWGKSALAKLLKATGLKPKGEV